jgi:ornithine cyclodeaminase
MAAPHIDAATIDPLLTWRDVVRALDRGHGQERAQLDDMVLPKGARSLLNRAAWIPGLGIGAKVVTVFPQNPSATPPRPAVQGVFLLFDEATGVLRATVDGEVITGWKTAADSVLGATYLARADSRELLIVGAGRVAHTLIPAYAALFPDLGRIRVWSRTPANARALARQRAADGFPVEAVEDLPRAVGEADIVATATFAREPILHGAWLRPGTHVDLIGAYRADMREADDDVLRRGHLFVDSRETTLEHIGELMMPIDAGVIAASDIAGDLHDLHARRSARWDDAAITVFKNGGGAHLDLMVADLMVRRLREARG